MRDTRQLTTFPPHHLTLCPEDICACGAEWNCLRITNFHLRHFRFVFFLLVFFVCGREKFSLQLFCFFRVCFCLCSVPLHSIIIRAINHLTHSTDWAIDSILSIFVINFIDEVEAVCSDRGKGKIIKCIIHASDLEMSSAFLSFGQNPQEFVMRIDPETRENIQEYSQRERQNFGYKFLHRG